MKLTLKTKLRIRFVLLSMLSLLLIQSTIVGISIYHNHQDLVKKSDMLISQIHNSPTGISRYFSVKIPAGTTEIYPDTVQHVSVSAEDAVSFAQRAFAKNRDKGFLDSYRYHIYRNENGIKIYFLQRESSLEMYKAAAENLVLVSVVGLVAICAILIPFSALVAKPLVDNHIKQKEFITAASHELKTPLTVISTHAQLLESEIGQNDWLDGIHKQIVRLTNMTQGLVALSKAEEYDNPPLRENFSFSEALQDVLETYNVVAKQSGIRIECTLADEIKYLGSKTEVQQLIHILLDNACKYCTKGGFIHVKAAQSFHGIKLSVVNTVQGMSEDSTQMLLLRFHRGQNAKNKLGFGLGLSIAEAIVKRHRGHLTVSINTESNFCVEVVLH